MKKIGVTGGVGCGKSQVLAILAKQYQAAVYEADKIGHLLMEPEGACYGQVRDLFGETVVNTDGTLNRKAIGAIAFADEEKLKQLNQIIHPGVKQYVIDAMEQQEKKGTKYFVIEAALLLEDDYDAICDELWYIYTDEQIRRQRLQDSRGYSDEYITEIMENQMPEEVFRRACDFVVDNSSSLESTKEQIDKRMQIYENM